MFSSISTLLKERSSAVSENNIFLTNCLDGEDYNKFKTRGIQFFLIFVHHYSSFFLQILVHVGFLTEESGDVFSPKVLKGGPLGEMVQWADILTALHVLGHNLKISMSVKELQG